MSLDSYRLLAAYPHEGGLFIEIDLNFRVTNTTSRAISRVAVPVEALIDHTQAREDHYKFGFAHFPRTSKSSFIRLDSTLLPGLYRD